MTAAGIFHFEEARAPAVRLASALGVSAARVRIHRFPDGESLVAVPVPVAAKPAILYCSLDHPNARLVELLLAAAALRDNGATRVALVAPYLGYMRQDMAFHPGEAVSQRVIGGLLAGHFDALFTIDPHLHRIRALGEVMPNIEAVSISAAPVLSAAIDPGDAPVVVGPDSESRQWVERIAVPHGLEILVGAKLRAGDRDVAIAIDGIARVKGRRAILVDDVVSSGETLKIAASQLLAAGATRVDALASHCLARKGDLAALDGAGIASLRASDSVAGPASVLPTAEIIARALKNSRIFGEC